ncbi:hypothetical protein [Hymenobacter perfusus]|uniref:Uncharacterized protein n=1 Tax=Hymenobacter perfusus TaxID=1236770 RepID=A0A3R9MA63_9BACT|nr:hypothetical protein [Hymenobacter perfusus]RSK40952.1 hypothetical protein EI293_18610 [Hymenobacter perfusus]
MAHVYRLWVLLCCALLPTLVRAQQLPARPHYTATIDSLTAALDKSAVPSGILYDRVFPLARLDQFGQTTTDTTRFEHFVQAHQELWYASYRAVTLGSATTLRARAAQHRQAGVVPIGVLHHRFNLLDTLAVQRNMFSQPDGEEGALFDVAGRAQSPCLTRKTV